MSLPDLRALLAPFSDGGVDYDLDGIVVLAASCEQLIEMKQVRGSAQDQADIETLRLLNED